MKDCWDLLNISPGSDKETIKKAYARLSKFYHPEEHPKEFMMLQKAYKEALRLAPEKQKPLEAEVYEDKTKQLVQINQPVKSGSAELSGKVFEPIDIRETEQSKKQTGKAFEPVDAEDSQGEEKELFREQNAPEYRFEEDPFYLERRKEMATRVRQAVFGRNSIDSLEELLEDLYFRAMLQDKVFHKEADTVLSSYVFRCRTKRVKRIFLQAKRLGLYSFTLSIQRCLKIRRSIPAVIFMVLWFLLMIFTFLARDPEAHNQKEYERMQEESAKRRQMEALIEENKAKAPAGGGQSTEWMQMLAAGELILDGEEGNQTLKGGYVEENGAVNKDAGTIYAEGIREIRYTFTEVLLLKVDDGWKIFDSRNKQIYDTDYMDILVVQIEDSAEQEADNSVVRKLAVTRDNEQWYLADLLGNIETEISGVPQGDGNAANAYDNLVRITEGAAMFSD